MVDFSQQQIRLPIQWCPQTSTIYQYNKSYTQKRRPRRLQSHSYQFLFDHYPLKSEPYCVKLTIGGYRLDYEEDATSPASELLNTNLMINSNIYDSNIVSCFLSCDLVDLFLETPIAHPEYIRMHLKRISPGIRDMHSIDSLISNDLYAYIKLYVVYMGSNNILSREFLYLVWLVPGYLRQTWVILG